MARRKKSHISEAMLAARAPGSSELPPVKKASQKSRAETKLSSAPNSEIKRKGGPQQVTARQVAKRAGTSQSAVSRTFTEGASVSPTTRRAVIEAAQALGYRPNLIARSLITGRSNVIGLVFTHIDNQFYPPLLEELSIRLGQAGYRILLFVIDMDLAPILEAVLSHRVDALIMGSATMTSHGAEACRAAGIPVLLLNHRIDREDISSVTGDNFNGARTIASFLVAGGHRSFAMIAGLPHTSVSRDRKNGFTSYLVEHGFGEPRCLSGDYSRAEARDAAYQLLSAPDRPDAIFCENDDMSLAVMGVARETFGLDVGKDLSIIGFDDTPIASWPEFKLTTYSQNFYTMVNKTVEILMRMLSFQDHPPEHAVIPGHLIVRGSARLPSTGIVHRDGPQKIWLPS